MADIPVLGFNRLVYIYTALEDESGDPVAAAYFPVACATSNTLTFSNSIVEGVVTKCNQNPIPTYGAESYTLSTDSQNMADDGVKASYNAVYNARKLSIDEKGYVYWKMVTTEGGTPTETKFGKGIIPELVLESPAEGIETFNFTINGVGEVSDTDLHV